ncbi:23S rRNA (adenine(2503)-C2)-methyltransferase, partial [bacterium]|nr:23S rRNA (adenine(2503)-C2)-methyltransferase [bacterium]
RQRSGLMPVNDRYPISDLLAAVRVYAKSNRQRVTFEYVLISGINDSDEDAVKLLGLLSGIRCKVNLIAYNPTSDRFARPEEGRIKRFAEIIQPLAAPITVRLSRGDDIRGACGQLAVLDTGTAEGRL